MDSLRTQDLRQIMTKVGNTNKHIIKEVTSLKFKITSSLEVPNQLVVVAPVPLHFLELALQLNMLFRNLVLTIRTNHRKVMKLTQIKNNILLFPGQK